jgi:hypothetical protein
MLLSSRTAIRDDVNSVRIRILFRVLAIILGLFQVYASIKSQSMNADGISYLDIGDAYFHGDWANAINAVWSPFYSWVLGFSNFVFRPSMAWQFPTVHITNFLIYLGAMASFEFLWERVRIPSADNKNAKGIQMPDWMWWSLGYLLFLWISLSLIELWSVTPDMLMAIFVLLAAGLIARIRSGDDRWRLFLLLGLLLGLGYLSKTFMFSVAFVFLALAWLVQKRSWSSVYRTAFSFGIFLFVSLPFILLISEKQGKFTIGESGTITFVRYVDAIPFPHWQGDPRTGVAPTHPSRIIHRSPAVYEFGEPVGGTYPIAMDPSYWYAGITPRFNLGGLLARLFASLLGYMELFLQKQGILFACVLALYMMGRRQKISFYSVLQRWALVIPAVIAFGLYALVLVEDRYVAVFILLFWADILANVCLPDVENNRVWLRTLGMIACLGLLANIVLFNLDGFKRLNASMADRAAEQAAPSARPLEVAQSLRGLGIEPGDRVGVIGYAYDSFWARLARVKIVAEMLEEDANDLWRGGPRAQKDVLDAYASVGADAVVAEYVPADARLDGWHQVGDSNFYIYILKK